jgi:transposase-like protein
MSDIDSGSLSDDVTSQNATPQINEPEDISQIKKHKSVVYNYFTLNKTYNRYDCKNCNKNYKIAKDGSTSSLWKHIKTKHNDIYLEIDQITDALNNLGISESLVYIRILF